MDNQQAYNRWADSYDAIENKTRDLDARALQEVMAGRTFDRVLEIGCGTGKNTSLLLSLCEGVTAVDFSAGMLAKARSKVTSTDVTFVQADVTKEWEFVNDRVDLISCSLMLEHIQNLDHIFNQAALALKPGGLFFLCELHPYKQYQGSKARFETGNGILELACFLHHMSDYTNAAKRNGFVCHDLQEWFDGDRGETPRLVSFLFKR